MAAYAIGHLKNVRLNEDIVSYLQQIDKTLAAFDGRFLIHGDHREDLEGAFVGDLIVIGFPTIVTARNWYTSPAYQKLIPLRTKNADGDVFLINGVDEDHRATDILPPGPADCRDGDAGRPTLPLPPQAV